MTSGCTVPIVVAVSQTAKRWARLARARLISECGGVCERCRQLGPFQFHITRQAGPYHRLSTDQRIAFYRA